MRENYYLKLFKIKWAVAFAIENIEAKKVAKIFIQEIVTRHSAPGKLLSDQGRQFMSKLIKEICEYMKTNKLSTTPYHPKTNGLTERFNKTLCQILASYSNEHQSDWDEYINVALFAYRVSQQEKTLKTPFEVLYGRTPRLPTEVDKNADIQVKNFDKLWKETSEETSKITTRSIRK
ncbi:unnamed protein product [Brachionus calyciflorus]|uniref:Integrase catalytic domain-containing protein n=1 Tax=Brachionus calyciflorus TaxID=104777 RepID=A0A814L903_9BILA|nr:unnamed protein product [Brachionus calyciflorus]